MEMKLTNTFIYSPLEIHRLQMDRHATMSLVRTVEEKVAAEKTSLFGMKGKVILSLGGLLVTAMLILGGSIYWQAMKTTEEVAVKNSNTRINTLAMEIEETLAADKKTLLSLRDTPPIQAIIRTRDAGGIDPVSKDSIELWYGRLNKIFEAFIMNHPQYLQIRYLDEKGNELVRVQSDGGTAHPVPENKLQNKASKVYVIKALKLPQDHVYVSDVSLNREYGKIQVPHVPTFRMATPVYFADKVRGIVIINFASNDVFRNVRFSPDDIRISVTDHNGYFIMHSDMSRAFGFDLGIDFRLKDTEPDFVQLSQNHDSLSRFHRSHEEVDGFRKIYFNPENRNHYWLLSYKVPAKKVFTDVYKLRTTMVGNGLIIILLSLLMIVWFVSRKLVTPVTRLATVAHTMLDGDLSVRADEHLVRDEFLTLYQTINTFAETQKQANDSLEQQIDERTKHLSCIVDNLVDGLITIDEKGIVHSFNPAAEEIFGYNADEVIGKNVKMLMPEPFHREHDGYLHNYLTTGKKKVIGISREVAGRRRDGSIFDLDLAVSETHTGGQRQFIGTLRDITERIHAERLIAENNQKLAMRASYDSSYAEALRLFSTTSNQNKILHGLLGILAKRHPFPVSAIYTYDEWSGTLQLAASHAAQDTLKKKFDCGEGLIGQMISEQKTIILETHDTSGLSIEAGVMSFAPVCIVITPIIYQEKTMAVLVMAASAVMDDMDKTFLDRLATQLGVAMNNLRQHRDLINLTEQLRRRGEEITQQNQQLEQANRMKSEFLANMSHELRTPLNAIIGFSEVLKDGIMGEMSPEQTEYIGDIFNSGQHLLSLINDILDLSKIEAGKMKLDLEEIHVPDLLKNSLSIVKEKAMAHRITLSQDIREDMQLCWLDGRKTKQIVYNLLSNAVKFTPDGGSVHIAARRVGSEALSASRKGYPFPLMPPTSQESDFLEISVSDTGIGISEADQKKLFTAFVQADSSLSRKFEGTGLGLVMVKRLAELHGGAVDMQSKEGKGSTFTVWLPWRTEAMKGEPGTLNNSGTHLEPHHGSDPEHESDQARGQASEYSNAAPAGQLSVLIIENEDPAAELIRLQLEDKGYRTSRAFSAENALEILADTKPDLITLDILMPGMDGWDLLAILKKDKALAKIPVVIVSIGADEKKGFALGAFQVLQKPVSKKLLLASVADADLGINHGITGTVLVVDDDPKAVDFISRHLENSGATILRAYGGTEAIKQATEKQPDLIFLDLMMPEVTGFDVVNALKANKKTARIPIIILTAKVITDEDRKALNGGILKVIGKSDFSHGSFIKEVQRAMGRKIGKNGKK